MLSDPRLYHVLLTGLVCDRLEVSVTSTVHLDGWRGNPNGDFTIDQYGEVIDSLASV